MNRLRFTTSHNLLTAADIDPSSQPSSQIPHNPVDERLRMVSSPVSHRSKRIRLGLSPIKTPRASLSPLQGRDNVSPLTVRKSVRLTDGSKSCSPTQSEESPIKKVTSGQSEYGELIPDEGGFSQFDI